MHVKPRLPSDHFAAFAFASADILLEVDESRTIIFTDGALAGLLGRSVEELTGALIDTYVKPDAYKRLHNIFSSLKRLQRIDAIVLDLLAVSGETVPFRLSGVYIDHKGGRFYLSLRAESLMQTPEDLDIREPMTGLLEKEAFAVKAGAHITKANQKGEKVQVTILDFPGLKDVLDKLTGHQAEQLMQSIGNYLQQEAVDTDAAGVISRESYSIITPASVKKEDLIQGVKDVARSQVKHLDLAVTATTVQTASEEYPLTQKDTANAVLYTINKFAQQRGEAFDIHSLNESYEEMLDDTLEHAIEFRRTLSEESFQLAFQPIVNIRTALVHHYECLVRLDSSDIFSNPFQFITFGENAGLIHECDLAITKKVLGILQQERRQGRRPLLAINLSGRSLCSNLFLDAFLSILRDHDDVRKQLIVEITESYKIEHMQMASDFVYTLKAEGTPVCLDDFGVGESSFEYLRNLAVDYVKIDGSYVRDSMKTDRGRRLLKAMANLCRTLDMMTIGEMVETQREASFLYECGVQYGQGYLFGKPDKDTTLFEFTGKMLPTYTGIFTARRFKGEDDDSNNGGFAA